MRMPNAERAVVDLKKLRDYCLSFEHFHGRHKARLFQSALGLTAYDAEDLRAALLEAARTQDAAVAEEDDYGQRYVVDFLMAGPTGRARVRSCWIIRRDENFPRLTTCYVL